MKAFSHYEFFTGKLADLDPAFPSVLRAWNNSKMELTDRGTHYGYVHSGTITLLYYGYSFPVYAGMYFCVPPGGCASIIPDFSLDHKTNCKGIVISRIDYNGMFSIGGPVETKGRLRYIDGCTDSLLIPPIIKGDPCLNLLYFPPGIDQTEHTHPSDRIGIIMSGRGQCIYRDDEHNERQSVDLIPGMIFCIHTNGEHKFKTPFGQDMRVLAFHPDSDFGPTHEDHPMLNRTWVDGKSAKYLDNIRTTKEQVGF